MTINIKNDAEIIEFITKYTIKKLNHYFECYDIKEQVSKDNLRQFIDIKLHIDNIQDHITQTINDLRRRASNHNQNPENDNSSFELGIATGATVVLGTAATHGSATIIHNSFETYTPDASSTKLSTVFLNSAKKIGSSIYLYAAIGAIVGGVYIFKKYNDIKAQSKEDTISLSKEDSLNEIKKFIEIKTKSIVKKFIEDNMITTNRDGVSQSIIIAEEDLICPISQEIIVDPIVAPDGHLYDRDQLQQWYDTGKRYCPVNRTIKLTNPSEFPTSFFIKAKCNQIKNQFAQENQFRGILDNNSHKQVQLS